MDALVDTVERRSKRSNKQRSRVTNGTRLFPVKIKEQSAWCRLYKDLYDEHLADLGGEANTSAAERSIVRRASVMETELIIIEAKFASAGESTADQLDLYSRVSSNLRRLLEAVGLRRRPRTVTDPLTYAATYDEQAP